MGLNRGLKKKLVTFNIPLEIGGHALFHPIQVMLACAKATIRDIQSPTWAPKQQKKTENTFLKILFGGEI